MAGEGFTLRAEGEGDPDGATPPPLLLLLDAVHFNLPWVLLLIFLAAFVVHSIASAESSGEAAGPVVTGPGGKPLPRSTKKREEEQERLRRKRLDFSPIRKLVFYYLSAGVIVSFLANATNIVIHALTKREEGWWCGEATAVRDRRLCSPVGTGANLVVDLCLRLGVSVLSVSDLPRGYHALPQRCPLHHLGGGPRRRDPSPDCDGPAVQLAA